MYRTIPEAKGIRNGELLYIQKRRVEINYKLQPFGKKFNVAQIKNQDKVVDSTRMFGMDEIIFFPNYKAGKYSFLYYPDTCCLCQQKKKGFAQAHCVLHSDM